MDLDPQHPDPSGRPGARAVPAWRHPRRPGLLLAVVAGTIAAVLIAVGAALSIQRHDAERTAVLDGAAAEAEAVAGHVGQFFRERLETLGTIAQAPLVRTGDPAAIKAWFEELVAGGSSFTGGLSLIGTDGMMVLLSGFPLDDPPVDLGDRDYVQAVLATGRPAFGNAIMGRRSGDPLLTFATPVRDETGAIEAILAGTIRLDLPTGGLARIGASLADAVVVDAAGQVVVDRGTVSTPVQADPAFLARLEGAAHAAPDLTGPLGQHTWLGGVAPIGDTGWWAAVLHDPDESLGPVDRARTLELAMLGLLGLAVLGVIAAVGRRLDREADEDRRAGEAVRSREAFLHEFADALPVIAGTLDDRLATTFANRALADRGTSDLVSLVHPEDRVRLSPDPARDREVSLDVRLAEAPGSSTVRWHRLRLVRSPHTPEPGWFFAAADIDDQKRAELGLQRDIAQRDEFLGLVSHELRTPLTVIIGTAATLSRVSPEPLPEPVESGIREIETSGRQLQRLLDNMLTLSQASGTRDSAPMEPQVPARLIDRTVSEFRRQHPDTPVVVRTHPDLPIVTANDTFTDQVLWNLLTNAAKYGGSSSTIEVGTRTRGDHLEISVTDGGPGVRAEDVDRLFEPHFRSREGRRTASGLGLGLTVCRRLVELQGGTISARRADGGGMTFAFTLPIAEE